ncbi:hypothetical protein BC829DRAFT_434834 [Chytridium lagenaria]|nr:hypothetical protein BC829DRAFT_434834 [Chytridium lagenaria]
MASNNASPSVTASASAPQTANTTPSSPSSKSSSRSYPSPPPIPSSPSATTHSHGDSHTKRRSRNPLYSQKGDTSATDLLQKIKNVQQVTQENNIKHKERMRQTRMLPFSIFLR